MKNGSSRASRFRRYLPAALVLIGGLALSFGLLRILTGVRDQRTAEEFDRRAGNILTFLSSGLNAHFEALYALRDFFRASEGIDDREFNIFVANQLARHPGLLSLGWAPEVPGALRDEFEAAVSADLGEPFQIRAYSPSGELVPAPEKPDYVPLTYIAPMPGAMTALGLDLLSEEARRSGVESAMKTGALATSPWIIFTTGGLSFLAIMPLYTDTGHSGPPLEGVGAGFVTAAIQFEQLVGSTVGQLEEPIGFLLYEGDPVGQGRRVFRYDWMARELVPVERNDFTDASAESDLSLVTNLDVGGQRWVLHFFPTPRFLAAQQTAEPWLAFVAGLILTALVTVYLLLSIRRTEQAEDVNAALETEIIERQRIQTQLRQSDAAHRFLAEASSVLVSSLDYETTLRKLAHLAVPTITDWCLVHILEPKGQLRRLEVAGIDGRTAERISRLLQELPQPTAEQDNLILRALRDAQPQYSDDVQEDLAASVFSEELRAIIREIRPKHAFAVPLVARGRTLGALTFITESPEGLDARERGLLEELARRAALQVDNARLYEDAQTASQSKSDFLAVMSHELRTPLNAIMGYADLLLMGVPEPPSEEQRRQLERINASARHLLNLIEEILTFSRTEEGHEEVLAEPLDLTAMLREILDGVRRTAKTKNLDVEAELPDLPIHLVSDPAKVRQILTNLLSNAVKFTEDGGMGVRVESENGQVVIEVWDTGIGISEAQRAEMFEPFWQAEEPTTRTAGGTGLGLTVSRRLARLLGGEVTVRSEPGVGSTFTLTLPREFDPEKVLHHNGRRV